MMNKRVQLSLISLTAAVTLFTGCSKNSGTGNDLTTGKQATSQTAGNDAIVHPNEPVELYLYSNTGDFNENSVRSRWWNYLNAKYPNFVLKFVPKITGGLPQLIASGQQIDIIYSSIGGANSNVIDNSLQFDMTELAKKHGLDLNRFEPETLDMIKQMGGLYGLPVANGRMVLFYNKDIFDKFGAPYPKDGMTWDDMLELSKKVSRFENDVNYFGFTAYIQHQMKMNQPSLDIVDKQTGRAAVNTDKWKTVLQKIMIDPILQNEAYRNAIIAANETFSHSDNFSKKRTVAMYSMSSVMPVSWENDANFATLNWDIVTLPTLKENPGVGPQPYPDYLYITNMSKNKDAAMEVIKFILSDEMQMIDSRKGSFTALKNPDIQKVFASETNVYKGKNINAVIQTKPAKPATITGYDDIVIRAVEKQLLEAVKSGGSIEINSLLRASEETANMEIEKVRRK
ncbi:MAG: extracellular solute-binding protein family 1 [Paenibacillus sp.]|nr:extracellular solute-binding protein family 1 [Paenibacillus sp.]